MKSLYKSLLSLPLIASACFGVVLYENDFESDTPGQQPSNVTTISAGGGQVIVLDGTTSPVNPLSGQSVLVEDSDLTASVRLDIELSDVGENYNNLRIAFDFQRAYAETDNDHRIDFGLGPSGVGLNSQANRTFDLRIRNTGDVVTKGTSTGEEPETLGTFDTTDPNSLVILVNSHNENTVAYDFPDTGAGVLSTNSYRIFLNGTDFGERPIFDNSNYYTASNVLGKIAFFQDSNSPGGIVYDNLKIETIFDPQTPVINEVVAASASVVAGDTTSITVGASGAGELSYQWYVGTSGDVSNPIDTPSGTETTVSVGPINAATSYWARVTNADGFTDSDAITIQIHEVRDPFVVNNQSELDALLGTLIAGDTVIIPDGEYTSWNINFFGEGTAEHPVVLTAENPGYAHFTGSSTLSIGGIYSEVSGLVFTGEYTGSDDNIIEFRSANGQQAQYGRFTNSAIIDYNPSSGDRTFWVNLYGTNNIVDYNYISGLDVSGLMVVAWLDGDPDYHVIANNHFANRGYGNGENGWETIRIGTSTTSLSDSNITVENNLFENCDGEIEIISNKSGGNIYRFNTFFESAGALTLRHGNGCLIDSNMFIGNNKTSPREAGGVRIIGTDHTVINNYFENTVERHDAVITVEAGLDDGPLNSYVAASNAMIAFNTIVGSSSVPAISMNRDLNQNWEGIPRTEAAENVVVANNIFARTSGSSSTFITGSPDEGSASYEGNIAFNGTVAGQPGFTIVDPLLALDPSTTIYRPAVNSPVIDAAAGDYSAVTTSDVDGDVRSGTYDVGADEVAASGLTPHTAATTGPVWLDEDRVLPTDQLPTWAGFEVGEDGWVDTEGWIGFVNVDLEPWYYSYQLNTFFYMTARPDDSSAGDWAYFATEGVSSDPGTAPAWGGYSLDGSDWGYADNLFGFFNAGPAPYIYVFGNFDERGGTDAFIYMPEPTAGFGGEWGYLFRP